MDIPSPIAIGQRITIARTAQGLTQEALAGAMGIASHQSISELEKGERGLSADELAKLSAVLKRDIDYFVDPFSLEGEANYSWRRAPETPDDDLKRFQSRADRLVGLLRWLRLQDVDSLDPLQKTLRISRLSTFEEAQAAGERLAVALKLGPVPAQQLLERVEEVLDVPVLHIDLDARGRTHGISAATVHVPNFTCILINRKEAPTRRAFDLAHELFHALTWDAMQPSYVESNEIRRRGRAKKDRVEQLADNFAAALLLPRALLERKAGALENASTDDLRVVATHFGVSPSALAWRLFNLRLINADHCDALAACSGDSALGSQPRLYSRSFAALLARAFESGRLSPRRAAKLLDLNLDELEHLFLEHGVETPIEF